MTQLFDGQKLTPAGALTASTNGTTITASASPNVKGAYTELLAATPFDSGFIHINISNFGAAPKDWLVDIAVGASSSEVVKIANLIVSRAGHEIAHHYSFPIFIPQGTRISARCQCTTGSGTVKISCTVTVMGSRAASPYQLVTTFGAATADSGGTSIDAGGSANTLGAYVQLSAAVPFDIHAVVVAFGGQLNAARVFTEWMLYLAVGAAASEVAKLQDWTFIATATSDIITPPVSQIIPLFIPQGSRLAAAARCDIIDATDRIFDLIVYGIS